MRRFLIFTLLFPPLVLVVFTAPDGFKASSIGWVTPTCSQSSPRG